MTKIKNGILLSGGLGTRLQPFTSYVSKHLLDVNGRPIIDYPLETLRQLGIEKLTVVLGGTHFGQIVEYIKGGKKWGFSINYLFQEEPNGIAFACNLCKDYVKDEEQFVLCLGDNLYSDPIQFNSSHTSGAQIVLYKHQELTRFGVASLDKETKQIVKMAEKPKVLDEQYDNYAITGCYLFDQKYFEFFKNLKPSGRGEFEVVEIIEQYHKIGELYPTQVGGYWSDAGTHASIRLANEYFYGIAQANHNRQI